VYADGRARVCVCTLHDAMSLGGGVGVVGWRCSGDGRGMVVVVVVS